MEAFLPPKHLAPSCLRQSTLLNLYLLTREHMTSKTNQTIDMDAREEGFFIAEIANTKHHVNFNLPKFPFKSERDILTGIEANAEEKRDKEVRDERR